MCGITGIIAINKLNDLGKRIYNMNQSLKHRGPDAQQEQIINDNIAFGHSRLSIIDLSENANQPMTSNNGRWVIVFNGEIMNHVDIKSQLNYDFKTKSDTEVILAALEKKGIEWFLNQANGMFAFAAYDNLEKRFFLVRDRFGIKPLFYTKTNNELIFASEIKAILHSGLVDAEFYSDAIDDYLGNRYVREPYTFFKNIFQLESSHYLEIDEYLNIKNIKYWELPSLNFDVDYDEIEIIKNTKEEVISAIKRWLIADVPVGSYLSGGIDSSLITAIMALNSNIPINTYTIGFKEEGFNEFEYSKMVAERYKTIHTEISIDVNSYIDEWDRLIYFKDAPLAVPNEIPLSVMTTELGKDIRVVISGEGADELFGGYGKIFRLPFDYNNHKYGKTFFDTFIKEYEYVNRKLRDKYLKNKSYLREFFDSKVSSDFNNYQNEENVFRFFHNYHIKGLLQRVDMTTMQASVEARPPFLDHQLIEYTYTKVPYNLKLKWLNNEAVENAKSQKASIYSEILDKPKYILKKISYEFLPKKVIERRKMGFPVPLKSWTSNLDKLAIKYLANAPWFNGDVLDDLSTDIGQGERSGQILWMFINVEMFRRKYFEREWRY